MTSTGARAITILLLILAVGPLAVGPLTGVPLAVAPAGPALAQEADGVPAGPPAAVVARVNEALLGAMREAESLGVAGRYQRLAPVLEPAFDFAFMARVSAGRFWRDLAPDERERLAEAFARMSVTTYAARFDGYDGERFEVGEAVEQPRGGVLVRNRLLRTDEPAVAIDYLLREFDGRWRIIDVFLDGSISELATKRSEYSAILDQDGFEALLAKITQKTDEMAGETAGG